MNGSFFCGNVLKNTALQIWRHYNNTGVIADITAVSCVAPTAETPVSVIEVEFANDTSIEGGTFDVWEWKFTKREAERDWFAWVLVESRVSLAENEEDPVLVS